MTRHYSFALAADLIIAHLGEIGPATTRDLIEETGKSRDTVRKAVNQLHSKRLIFIKDWPYTGVQRARLWALRTGKQSDAPRPAARSMTELKREWSRRNKAVLKARRSMRAATGNPFAMLMT